MFLPKKKLAVKIAEVDGIKVNDMYLSVACKDKVFEKFASDSSSSYHQYTSLLMEC